VAKAQSAVEKASQNMEEAHSAVREAYKKAAEAEQRVESAKKVLQDSILQKREAQKKLRELESKNELSHDKVSEEALVKAKSDYESWTQDYLDSAAAYELERSERDRLTVQLKNAQDALEKREIALKDAQAVLQASGLPQPKST